MLFTRKKNVLKILRGDLAKEFDMIHVAKDGDVGLDIPIALPYRDGFKEEMEKYVNKCNDMDKVIANVIKHGCVVINPGERCLLPTDIRIELPHGYWASIEARSSTSKLSLVVPKGVIDEGYRGELFAQILNVGKEPVTIKHGDRLIQLLLHKRIIKDFDIEEVDELSESERGESGFGSSGKSALK